MYTGKHTQVLKHLWVFIGVILTIASCTSPATEENQGAQLNELYGTEVEDTIASFESQWLSLEAHLNPSLQSELATGPYLEAFGYASQGQDLYNEPFWLVTTSASVQSIRVLEYNSERFKTVACVTSYGNRLTTDGEFIEQLSPYEFCGVYVFAREDNLWKLAGFFNMADRRDWDYAPNWLQEIIGELPEEQ